MNTVNQESWLHLMVSGEDWDQTRLATTVGGRFLPEGCVLAYVVGQYLGSEGVTVRSSGVYYLGKKILSLAPNAVGLMAQFDGWRISQNEPEFPVLVSFRRV